MQNAADGHFVDIVSQGFVEQGSGGFPEEQTGGG